MKDKCLFILMGLIITLALSGCVSGNLTSRWNYGEIEIDGNDNEWDKTIE